MDESKYYYAVNGVARGPVEASFIHLLLRRGEISPETQVRPDWSDDWQPLYLFDDLSIPASEIGGKRKTIIPPAPKTADSIIVVSTDDIPGKERDSFIGLVCANVVMSKHVGSDVMAGFKSIFGGEIEQYTKLMNDARDVVLQRIKERAFDMGADAICGFRMTSSEIMQGSCEICGYGTAVKLFNPYEV